MQFKATAVLLLLLASSVLHGQAIHTSPTLSWMTMPNITDRPPPIAEVFCIRGRENPEGEYEMLPVIMAMWQDGTVMWSHDLHNGGFPYKEAQLTPEKVQAIIDKVNISEFLKSDRPKEAPVIVDGAAKAIVARKGLDMVYLQSNHENYPISPPPFLADWDRIKNVLLSAIPSEGRPVPEVRFESQRINSLTGEQIKRSSNTK